MKLIDSLRRDNNARLAIDFAQHDVDAAQDDHHVRDGVAKAHVFQHGEVDEARRAHAIAIRISRPSLIR